MWRSLALSIFMIVGLAATAQAEGKPLIVVELYTSQGCSSCPPADKFLHELAKRNDVIALGLHVDYWDYIGWKDVFGNKAYAERQRAYAHVGGRRSVYTPQMIIQGQDHVVGNHPKDVNSLVKMHQAKPVKVALSAVRDGSKVNIEAKAAAGAAPAVVLLVRYEPSQTTRIVRGENAGRDISYANIVHELKVVGRWDMAKPLNLSVRSNSSLKTAIIVQSVDHGPILAAARVE